MGKQSKRLEVKLQHDDVQLPLDVEFVSTGGSVYAVNDAFDLCAGSQDAVEDRAEFKALFRMFVQFMDKVEFFRSNGYDLRGIFRADVVPAEEEIQSLIRFVQSLTADREYLAAHERGMIPYYSENLTHGADWSEYELNYRGTVQDVQSIQESEAEYMARDAAMPLASKRVHIHLEKDRNAGKLVLV